MGPYCKGDEVNASKGEAKLLNEHVNVWISYQESCRCEAQEHGRVRATKDLYADYGSYGGGDAGPEDHDCVVNGPSEAGVCNNDGCDTCEEGDGEVMGNLWGKRQDCCKQGSNRCPDAAANTPPEDLEETGDVRSR